MWEVMPSVVVVVEEVIALHGSKLADVVQREAAGVVWEVN